MYKIRNIKPEKLEFIPSIILDLIRKYRGSVVLAGGFGRGLLGKSDMEDFDLFFVNEIPSDIQKLKDVLECHFFASGFKKIFQCEEDKLRTYKLENIKIQVIDLDYYNDIAELINSFDINACRFAFTGYEFYTDKQAIKDVFKNHITLNKLTYPVATIKRIAKYYKKGYKVTLASQDFVAMLQDMMLTGEVISDIVYVD